MIHNVLIELGFVHSSMGNYRKGDLQVFLVFPESVEKRHSWHFRKNKQSEPIMIQNRKHLESLIN